MHNMWGMAQVSDLMASVDVCESLNIDRSTLSRWVAAGRIRPAMKLPGKTGGFLFDPDEVERVRATGRTTTVTVYTP